MTALRDYEIIRLAAKGHGDVDHDVLQQAIESNPDEAAYQFLLLARRHAQLNKSVGEFFSTNATPETEYKRIGQEMFTQFSGGLGLAFM